MGELLLLGSVFVFCLLVYLLNVYIPSIENNYHSASLPAGLNSYQNRRIPVYDYPRYQPISDTLKKASRRIDFDANVAVGYNNRQINKKIFDNLSPIEPNNISPLKSNIYKKQDEHNSYLRGASEVSKINPRNFARYEPKPEPNKQTRGLSSNLRPVNGGPRDNAFIDAKEFYSNNKSEFTSTKKKPGQQVSAEKKRWVRHKFFDTPFGQHK